ncbi:MAG: two-component system, NarL family, nitrate/nitrite response regulator NarL [Solirubrobacteraceae bacterium]|nr:two-component system, NarL family, nitrate/nitrite response regulator NarL [Solirubrobacteraceae bacterium]
MHLFAFALAGWLEGELGALTTDSRVLMVAPLTALEREILQLVADGLSGPGIAKRLSVMPRTVNTHLARIYEKLGVGDRARAVERGLRLGFID